MKIESVIIKSGEVGHIFYTEKSTGYLTGLAKYYGRKISTKGVTAVDRSGESTKLTKVTINA